MRLALCITMKKSFFKDFVVQEKSSLASVVAVDNVGSSLSERLCARSLITTNNVLSVYMLFVFLS